MVVLSGGTFMCQGMARPLTKTFTVLMTPFTMNIKSSTRSVRVLTETAQAVIYPELFFLFLLQFDSAHACYTSMSFQSDGFSIHILKRFCPTIHCVGLSKTCSINRSEDLSKLSWTMFRFYAMGIQMLPRLDLSALLG